MAKRKSKDPFYIDTSQNSSSRIEIDILGQPDDATCGPTCLHAVYRFYNDHTELKHLISEVHKFEDGGTLAVWLGCHALERGYEATLYTCNLQLFDPTWFKKENTNLYKKLEQQMHYKKEHKMLRASKAFMDFLKLGGIVKLEDLTRDLLLGYLRQGIPILTGLSSTYLYRSPRVIGDPVKHDDIRGEPEGHFVILCGYDKETKQVLVADPYTKNPYDDFKYEVKIDRLICSILIGILTYDANFLIIKPRQSLD